MTGRLPSFTYNTQGHQSARTSPDAGTTSRSYDATDKLRYSQDANQAAAGQVYFTNYDYGYRPLTSGQGTATFASLDPNAATPPALETNTANWLTVRAYDAKPSTTAFPWSLFSTQINAVTLANAYGRLAATANRSNGAWQVQLFSYDTDGRVAKRHTFTQANGGGSVLTALNDSVTYTRDLRDAVTVRRLGVGSNTWHQWFDYDNRGLLWKVFASTSPTKPGTPDVTYTNRPSGSVHSRQFQGGSLDSLRYTIREQIERIGIVEGGPEPFAARYVYNRDGTVAQAEFRSEGAPSPAPKRYLWDLSYDPRKRLSNTTWYLYNGGWSSTQAYRVSGMNYDASGNLTSLARNDLAAGVVDNITYTYPTPATSNRLSSLSEFAGVSPQTWDAEAGAFSYDLNGNMLTSPAPYSITAATYDPMNLPTSLTRSGVTATYRYNAEGQRIAKQVGTGNTEIYILDGRTTLAVYSVNGAGAVTSAHNNIVAGPRVVGRYVAGVKRYYHTDLLGSTRAVVENGVIVESYDYDPWGVLLEGRTLAGPTKEGFTGKERDAETGLDYFGFRYYMPAIGRWTTIDPPADSFPSWSPYNYVYNNPVSYTDPYGLNPCLLYPQACILAALAVSGGIAAAAKQAIDNHANGRPLTEGVASAALHGALEAGTVGLGAAAIEGFALRMAGVSVAAAGGAGAAATASASVTELIPTHGPTLSRKAMARLTDDIAQNGIREPIKYVDVNGSKFIVDGYHRWRAALGLGIREVPVQQVSLPYRGYRTIADLELRR